MLKIKLARFGKKNQPHYRIVITEGRSKRDGEYKVAIGRYVPTQQPKILEIDLDAYAEWVKKGAQPTDTVASLAKRLQSGNPFPEKKPRPSKKAVAKAQAAAEAQEQEKAAPAEDTTPVEAPAETTETPAAETTAPEVSE